MIRLKVHSCGPAVTLQDAGRFGALRMGISASGAMDMRAYRLANALVGAEPGAAVLEFGMVGGQFSVDAPALVSVTGGRCPITVDGAPREPWTAFRLEPGRTLNIGTLTDAVYGYIAISDGIDVPPFMGSRSTHSRSGLGGHDGRTLTADDLLPVFPLSARFQPRRLRCLAAPDDQPLRVVAGPQDDHFTSAAWQTFLREDFVVTAQRDRMGMCLEGPRLEHSGGFNIVSDAISFGSIQVPGSGQPLILLADRQPTGGYPKIATVISSDLARMVQKRSGQIVRFRAVTPEQAEDAAIAQNAALLAEIADLEPFSETPELSSERLLSLNLIGGVVG